MVLVKRRNKNSPQSHLNHTKPKPGGPSGYNRQSACHPQLCPLCPQLNKPSPIYTAGLAHLRRGLIDVLGVGRGLIDVLGVGRGLIDVLGVGRGLIAVLGVGRGLIAVLGGGHGLSAILGVGHGLPDVLGVGPLFISIFHDDVSALVPWVRLNSPE